MGAGVFGFLSAHGARALRRVSATTQRGDVDLGLACAWRVRPRGPTRQRGWAWRCYPMDAGGHNGATPWRPWGWVRALPCFCVAGVGVRDKEFVHSYTPAVGAAAPQRCAARLRVEGLAGRRDWGEKRSKCARGKRRNVECSNTHGAAPAANNLKTAPEAYCSAQSSHTAPRASSSRTTSTWPFRLAM